MGTVREDQRCSMRHIMVQIFPPENIHHALSELAQAHDRSMSDTALDIVWRAVAPDDYMFSHSEEIDVHLDGEQGGTTTKESGT